MDDLSEKLSDILNDPEAMDKVRIMAENLLGGDDGAPTPRNEAGGLDGETLNKIMSVMSKLRQSPDDNRSTLLLALKPHISEERQHKVDTAVKLLKLIELLPFLKESGLLNF